MDNFLNLLDNNILNLSDEFALIVYDRVKEKEMYKVCFDQDLIKIFKKACRDLLFCEVDIEKIKDQFASISLNVEYSKLNDEGEKSNDIFVEKFDSDYNNVMYLAAIQDINIYLYKCKNGDISEFSLLKNKGDLLNYYATIFNSIVSFILDEENDNVELDFKETFDELFKSNINIRDKFDVIKSFLERLKNIKFEELTFKNEKLKEHYKRLLDEIENSKDDDEIKLSKRLLSTLGIKDSFVNGIIAFDEKQRQKKEIKTVNISVSSGLERYEEKEEEKNKLKSKLEEYFDLKDMHLKRFLNREETNIVLSILKELGYGEEIIRKFIWDNDTLFPGQDFIVRCEYILGRAKFYSSAYGFEKEYNDFEDYYNGYLEAEDEEYKEFHYELLGISYNEIMSFLKSIPKTYEYELNMKKVNFKLILSSDNK